MGLKLLDSFPEIKSKVKHYERVLPHSLIDWENKIDPVLFELAKMPGTKKTKVFLDNGRKAAYCGNVDAWLEHIKKSGREQHFTEAQLFLYVYGGLTDLSLLRRIKEFPDETPRGEIEAYWLAESVEAASILIINPEKA